jgi:cyclopropane-fatty-acyl-phospholipid synthase
MAHYDLGNDFYASWLDAQMSYSSAIFEDLQAPESLEVAQRRKFARLAEMLQLEPNMTVLEIGCGWGSLAEYLAKTHKVKVTAITISPAQFSYATKHVEKTGVGDLVDVRLCDYRDIQGQYDRVVSVEMYEAVGEKYWPQYSKALADRLKPGGRAVLQVITIAERWWPSYRKGGDFIQRYIFPGGMLPTENLLQNNLESVGLRMVESQNYGLHYARTLNEWRHRFQRVWPELASDKRFDQHFKNLWDLYLCYCEAGFKVGTTDLVQMAIIK